MKLKLHLIYAIFLISVFAYKVNAQCKITKDELEQERNRIFAVRLNEHIELLHTNVVPLESELHMICNTDNINIKKCTAAGQWQTIIWSGMPCNEPLKGSLKEVSDAACQPHKMLLVGYKISYTHFLELFRSCFDDEHARAKFTIHDTYNYPQELSGPRPNCKFVLDQHITPAVEASYDEYAVDDRFDELLSSKQQFIRKHYAKPKSKPVINRGHLTPASDFMFSNYKFLTCRYINMIPQWKTINGGNWERIESWVRNNLVNRGAEKATVVTGALDEILELKNAENEKMIPMYLATKERNPIPKWNYKIVGFNARNPTVFVTHNSVFDKDVPQRVCSNHACPNDIQLTVTKMSGYSYCCDFDEFKNNFLPHLNVYNKNEFIIITSK